jgi:hypothetical protein
MYYLNGQVSESLNCYPHEGTGFSPDAKPSGSGFITSSGMPFWLRSRRQRRLRHTRQGYCSSFMV